MADDGGFFGTPRFYRLDLEDQPNGIPGTYSGIKLTGN